MVRAQPNVADAASTLWQDVDGKDTSPHRLVCGVARLPRGTPVELAVMVEVRRTGVASDGRSARLEQDALFNHGSIFLGGCMATTRAAGAPMKVAQIPQPGADFQIVEREMPTPGVGHVRIKVQACGVCHSDVFTKDGSWPGIQYPRVPGHEIAGIIDELGAGVTEWKQGQRVGIGWHGGAGGTGPPRPP